MVHGALCRCPAAAAGWGGVLLPVANERIQRFEGVVLPLHDGEIGTEEHVHGRERQFRLTLAEPPPQGAAISEAPLPLFLLAGKDTAAVVGVGAHQRIGVAGEAEQQALKPATLVLLVSTQAQQRACRVIEERPAHQEVRARGHRVKVGPLSRMAGEPEQLKEQPRQQERARCR